MKFSHGAAAAIILAGGLLAGCMQTKTIQTKAIGPTSEEAKSMAKAQLDQQITELQSGGGKYHASGSPHFTTKVLPQADGGNLYEVTGSEKAVMGK